MKRDVVKLVGVAAVLVVGFVLAASWYSKGEKRERTARVAAQTKIAKRAPLADSVFVRPHSRSRGPANAKVTVVEFLDPECESCRVMYPRVEQLVQRYASSVRFVIRYMPLHPNSVLAIGALEAAGEQDHYWEMLETLFGTQPEWGNHHHPRPELIPGYARVLGLDMQAFDDFLRDGDYRRIVEMDQADGRTLGVSRTPAFFVNGRLLEQLGSAQLQALIDEELAK